jgi:hypothetical protein
MRGRPVLLAFAALLYAASVAAQSPCAAGAAALHTMEGPELGDELVRQISAGRDDCANGEARQESIARSSLDGPAGWDSRFALREAVLEVVMNARLPSGERVELLQSAVAASLSDSLQRRPEDLQADARMAMLSLPAWGDDCTARFAAMALAARIDQRLPMAARDGSIGAQEMALCMSRRADGVRDLFRGIDQIFEIERISRGDPKLWHWRWGLAWDLAFSVSPVSRAPEDQMREARQIVQLVDDLSDVSICGNQCREWPWRPLWNAFETFHRFGDPQAAALQRRVLTLVSTMHNDGGKLRALQSMCLAMLGEHFSAEDYQPITQEIRALANSLPPEASLLPRAPPPPRDICR